MKDSVVDEKAGVGTKTGTTGMETTMGTEKTAGTETETMAETEESMSALKMRLARLRSGFDEETAGLLAETEPYRHRPDSVTAAFHRLHAHLAFLNRHNVKGTITELP